jgi:hypothetical protein
MPKAKTGRAVKIVAVVALIAVICVGVYVGLAWPTPIYSQPFSFSGATSQTYSVAIGFPKSQIQVVIELSAASALWNYEIKNSSGDVIGAAMGLATSPGTYASVWLNAAGSCTVTIICVGSLTGTLTVLGRGMPFTTA